MRTNLLKTSSRFAGILFLLLVLTAHSFAQSEIPRDEETGNYIYQKVIKADSLSKQKLYNNAKLWVLKKLKIGGCMVQLDEKDFNTISGVGTVTLDKYGAGFGGASVANGLVTFTFTLQFKEGRYKYTFENFTFSGDKSQGDIYKGRVVASLEELTLGDAEDQIRLDTNRKIKALISSLSTAMHDKTTVAEDW